MSERHSLAQEPPPRDPCDVLHRPRSSGGHGHGVGSRDIDSGSDDHQHSHGHDPGLEGGREDDLAHPPESSSEHRPKERRRLLLSVALTTTMMVVEIVGGAMTHSLALVSDAAHMLSHALALSVSYLALRLAAVTVSRRYSFGLYRTEVLAALFNGVTLLGFAVAIVGEGVRRLVAPVPVQGLEMLAVAVLGLAVNVATAFILGGAHQDDLNTRSAFFHMLADTASSVAIVAGAILISFTGWFWVDPALSVVVSLVVFLWGWGLVRAAVRILLERAPDSIDPIEIERRVVEEHPHIHSLHDLHVWQITSGMHCLAAHVVVAPMALEDTVALRARLKHFLAREFAIDHATLEVEPSRSR